MILGWTASVQALDFPATGQTASYTANSTAPNFAQGPKGVATFVPCGGPTSICPDPNPNDCLVPRCIESHCEYGFPAADGALCPDLDRNPCTVASCLRGACSQTGTFAAENTPCSDTDGNSCTVAHCQAGSCNQGDAFPQVPSMQDLTKVEVTAREVQVTESEAYTDCCWLCEPQWLGALRPTANGPELQEPDGGLPLRTTYCGKVVRYGVNDENADPRDIMLNMEPSPGFEHFVKGFLNTECTDLSDAEKSLFVKKDPQCPASACLAASENPARTGRCIHVEVTPAEQFYGKDSRFLPIDDDGACDDGWGCKSALEPAGQWSGSPPPGGQAGQEGQEACVSGVYAVDHGKSHRPSEHRELCCSLDAGHDRPEIHPMDAIWFRQPNGALGWIFGVFQDDSNRYSFPHCSDYHNDNRWSQGPRDMTFRFPFRLTRGPIPWKACLRHNRKGQGTGPEILPVNVTTSSMPQPLVENKVLLDGISAAPVLEVIEQPGAEGETQVRLDGCVTGDQITGFLTVRVAVGCSDGGSCPGLNDSGDPGSGFYYGEVVFQGSCG